MSGENVGEQIATENINRCVACGNWPTAVFKAQSASSRIIWWNYSNFEENVCGVCAERVYYEQQSRNLIQGWWGPISAAATLVFLTLNLFRISENRKKIDYVTDGVSTLPRPHLHVRKNPVAMSLTAVVIVLVGWFAVSDHSSPPLVSNENPTSYLGTCWEDTSDDKLRLSTCSGDSTKYIVYSLVPDGNQCLDVYMNIGSEFACLKIDSE